MWQGFGHFSGFLHHFVMAKLASSSIRARGVEKCCAMVNMYHAKEVCMKMICIKLLPTGVDKCCAMVNMYHGKEVCMKMICIAAHRG